MTGPFDMVARWWRSWTTARASVERLDFCGSTETERIAHDVGVSVPELRALAGRWPDAANSLYRRLATLELGPDKIRESAPQVMPDLQRVCTMCRDTRECQHDLTERPVDPRWRQYCSNVSTLDALVDECRRSKGAD